MLIKITSDNKAYYVCYLEVQITEMIKSKSEVNMTTKGLEKLKLKIYQEMIMRLQLL